MIVGYRCSVCAYETGVEREPRAVCPDCGAKIVAVRGLGPLAAPKRDPRRRDLDEDPRQTGPL